MMKQEQHKQGGSHPFAGSFSPQVVAHEEQHCYCHEKVNEDFQMLPFHITASGYR